MSGNEILGAAILGVPALALALVVVLWLWVGGGGS